MHTKTLPFVPPAAVMLVAVLMAAGVAGLTVFPFAAIALQASGVARRRLPSPLYPPPGCPLAR